MPTNYRDIPSVSSVLEDERVKRLVSEYTHAAVLDVIRREIASAREAIRNGEGTGRMSDLVGAIEREASKRWRSWPVQVINATGVVLHTNLGRAPLSTETISAMQTALAGYTDIELDLESGTRGSRQAHLSHILCQLTGAEAALAVNNNASAVLLGLTAVASGSEVIVSRGQAIEIGGGFRVPDVLSQSGVTLVEVGTTNKTYVRDYEEAINENTGALLVVHASNFRVTGFTDTPELRELVELGRSRNLPVLHDLGSGCLLDSSDFGLAHEPMPQESVAIGSGLAFFSGDKLLGGPQAGIMVGDGRLVSQASKHPLARAVRIDKVTLAGLVATLMHYVKDEVTEKIPIWAMLSQSQDVLDGRVQRWLEAIGQGELLVDGESTIGGGSLPGETLNTTLLGLRLDDPESFLALLRSSTPPVIARIQDQCVLLDPRTVLPQQDNQLIAVVQQSLAEQAG